MQKEKVQQVLDKFSDDVDVEVLAEKLSLLQEIEIAEQELARGEGIPHGEVEKHVERWLK